MKSSPKRSPIQIDTPSTYRIRIQGAIDAEWSDLLSDMRISTSEDESDVTVLTGTLPDQAALFGVLNTLYDMHIPLLSIENLSMEEAGEAP